MRFLTRQDLESEQNFIERVARFSTKSGGRKKLKTFFENEASRAQLQLLLRLAAAVVFLELPISEKAHWTLLASKRKNFLKKLFVSRAKTWKTVREANKEKLTSILVHIIPVLSPILSSVFEE